MVELQKERGLTESYINNPSELFKEKAHLQRKKTNQVIKAFSSINASIDKSSNIIEHLTGNQIIQEKLNKLSQLIEQLQLHLNRSLIDDDSANNPFDFYSSLIAKIIDIIENIELVQTDPIQSKLTRENY